MTMFAHTGYHGFDAAQGAEEIGFHGLAEDPHRHLLHRSPGTHTSVVHENVDATVLRKHLLDRITDGSLVVYIERSHRHREAFCRDDLPKLTGPVHVSHRRDYGVSATPERHRSSQSDATTGAGNQRKMPKSGTLWGRKKLIAAEKMTLR